MSKEKRYRLKPEVLKYINSNCKTEGTLDYWKGTIYKEEALEEVKPLIVKQKFHFELYPEDAPQEMTWEEAVEYCESLGDGWRLPTIEECFLMYNNKVINNNVYWSSTEYVNYFAWFFYFNIGNASYNNEDVTNYVRAVRTIK
jgi:hypothetical protein